MIPVGLTSVICATTAQHGITPAQIAVLGDLDSPLLNDPDVGETTTELLWALLTPLPSSGTTAADDLGGYELVGASDGEYVQAYRLLAMPASGSATTTESTISSTVGAPVSGPTIAVQPQSLAVYEGSPAVFGVTATGTGDVAYQWRRNGVDIADEVMAAYALSPALMADTGAVFSVLVSDDDGSVISASATLTVNSVESTLIVEDGTAKTDADSYISLLDANIYHSRRGNAAWALLGNADKEAALVKATDYMVQVYRWRWAGNRKTSAQSLDWPRQMVPDMDAPGIGGAAGGYIADTIVPLPVQRACADLALRAAAGDLAPDVGRVAATERLDVITIEYDSNAAPWVRYRAVDNMLTAYFKPSSGSSISLSRA